MALGKGITAKGKRIDFAELARRSKKPIQSEFDVNMKATTTVQKPPAPVIRARGFMPTHAGVKIPEYDRPAPAGAFEQRTKNKPLETKSLADYTAITIDEAKHLKEQPEDAAQTANQALAEIMSNDLNRAKRVAAAPRTRRS
jgi:hypothetical protein